MVVERCTFVFGSERGAPTATNRAASVRNEFFWVSFRKEKKHPNALERTSRSIFIYMSAGYINTQQKCYKYIGKSRLFLYVAVLPFLSN
jgi:hypothetical protein